MEVKTINDIIVEFTIPSTGREYKFGIADAFDLKHIKTAMETGAMDKTDLIINTGYERIFHTPEEIFELADITTSQITKKQNEFVEKHRAEYSERLKLVAETEKEFTKSCTIVDYAGTKRILESVNSAILSGVEVNDIIKILDTIRDIKK